MLKGGFDGVKTFPVRGKVYDPSFRVNRRSSFPRQVEVAAPTDLTGCVRRRVAAAVVERDQRGEACTFTCRAEPFETMTHATENRSSASDR